MLFSIRRGGRSIRRSGLCLALVAGLSTAASADVTVNTGTTGPVYGDGGTFTVTAAGSISGGSQGVIAQLPSSGITILSNSGTIQGSNGIENYGAITTLTNDGRVTGLGDWGIYTGAGYSLGALTNSGTISAANHGYGLYGTSDSLTNQAGGLIAGTSGYALYLSGTLGTVSNAGAISSNYRSIINLGTLGSVTNSGLVSTGGDWNFLNYGSLNSITNSGTFQSVTNTFGLFTTTGTLANQTGGLIQATNGYALYVDSPGSLATLTNAGTIASTNNRTIYSGSAIGTFTNSGLVTTGGDYNFLAYGSVGTITNSGTFQGPTNVFGLFATTGTLANEAGGVIQATNGYAVYVESPGSLGTLTNAGTIASTNNRTIYNSSGIGTFTNSGLVTTGADWTFLSYGSLGVLTNSGTIQGPVHAIGIYGASGTIANQAGGSMSGGTGYGVYLSTTGSAAVLSNAGSITSSSADAVSNQGKITSLTNDGQILGSRYGLHNSGGTISSIVNSGTISGVVRGIYNEGNANGSLVNQAGGLISGSSNAAIDGRGFASIDNYGTIAGASGISNGQSPALGTIINRSGAVISARGGNAVYTTRGLTSLTNEAGGQITSTGDVAVKFVANVTTINNAGLILSTYAYGEGIRTDYTIDSLTNSGTIQAGSDASGIYLDVISGTLTNTATGLIQGGKHGYESGGDVTAIVNAGQFRGGKKGVEGYYGIASLVNQSGGVISGTTVAGLTLQDDYGTITNQAGGLIESAQGDGIFVAGSYTRGEVTNAGLVTGGTAGIRVSSGNFPSFSNSGTVQGTGYGALLAGTTGTFSNLSNGRISATNDDGVQVSGVVTSLSNAGTISGGTSYPDSGIELVGSGTIGTLTNSGNVVGGFYGVQTRDSSGIGSIVNSGTIQGAGDGIYNNGNLITSLVNQAGGLIKGTNNGMNGGGYGTLDNYGTIEGSYGIQNNQSPNLGTFINRSTGIVSGTGSGYGFYSSRALGSFTNEAGGLIQSTNYQAVFLAGNGVGTFNNAGVIRTLNDQNYEAIRVSDDIVSLTNSGTIAGYHAIRQGDQIGTLTNTATGLLKGTYSGLYVSSSYDMTVINYGQIVGGQKGVYGYYDFGPLTNKSGGVISGTAVAGITIEDDARTVQPTIINEAGALVTSANGAGVLVSASGYTPGTIVNAGRIEGATGGVRIAAGGLKWVANTGTIAYTGTGTGPAVFVGTGRVLGDATGASGPALTSTGAGALIAGTIENQGTVHYGFTIDNQNVTVSAGGGAGTFTSGTLQVTDGNLTFTNGQTTLGADISVNGGAGTVLNEGTLRLLGIENVTGNFQQTSGATVLMGLLGTGSGQYGRLDMTGSALFAGTLALDATGLSGGVADGQIFQLFEFGSYSGGFGGLSLNGTPLTSAGSGVWSDGNLLFTEQWTGTSMSLAVSSPSVIPEIDPAGMASVLSLVVGSLGLAERRLRRGRRAG